MIKTQQLTKVALQGAADAQTNVMVEQQGQLHRLPADALRSGYATVQEMKDACPKEGSVVSTRGYYSENDGGGASYFVRRLREQEQGGAGVLVLGDGLCAELVPGGVLNVKQLGAVGDGVSDDGPALREAFAYAAVHLPCEVYLPRGEYQRRDRLRKP